MLANDEDDSYLSELWSLNCLCAELITEGAITLPVIPITLVIDTPSFKVHDSSEDCPTFSAFEFDFS